MKSSLILLLIVVTMHTVNAQETILGKSAIPVEIQNYLDKHFPGIEVLQVIQDNKPSGIDYEVYLKSMISLEFNGYFQIVEIESNNKLPDSVIPPAILNYVHEKFPDNFITEWELEKKHQQIQLDNKLELEFSLNGEFLRFDN